MFVWMANDARTFKVAEQYRSIQNNHVARAFDRNMSLVWEEYFSHRPNTPWSVYACISF